MSSGFDSSSMNHKYEMPKTDRLQGAPAAESLKSIAQLNPASFSAKAAIRYPVAAMQVIGTLPGTTAVSTLSAPLLPKIAVSSGPLPLQPNTAAVPNATERSQQPQPVPSVPSAAATAAAVAPAVVASSFSGQAAQQSAVSIIRPSTPMHTPSAVANIFAAGVPRVVTTDTKKTITAPPSRPVVLPHGAFPRLQAPLAGLATAPVVPQVSATLPTVTLPGVGAAGSPQLLLSSPLGGGIVQPGGIVPPGAGLRNLSQHAIRPGTPPASGKLPANQALGAAAASAEQRISADHHRFSTAPGPTVGGACSAVGISVPVTSVVTAVPPASTASTVQITIHQPKAATSAATVVADRLSFARLPPTTALPAAGLSAAAHVPRPIIPQSLSSVAAAAAVLPAAQPNVAAMPRAVPVISTPGNAISIPMVVTTTPAAAAAAARPAVQQRSAGQHDYSRHEPGTSSMPVYDSLSKPHVGTLMPAASAQASADGFSGRITLGGSAMGSSSLSGGSTTAVTTMMPNYLAQEQLYAAAQSQLGPLGIISASQPQFGPAYLRGQYRTTIYPSPQPSMSTIVSSSTTRALLLPATVNARPLAATTVLYGQAGQNGADDVAAHSLPGVSSVIVSNTAVGLQQSSATTPGGVGSSSPRPSILRKRAAGEGGSSNNNLTAARRVLPLMESVSLGSGSAAAKITDAANMHIRAESPKLQLPFAGSGGDRVPASRRSSTDTATDPGLSIDSPSPTSVKQEPMDMLENGLPVLPYSASADVSPRKKPRKQLLNTVSDYKEEDYSTEEETETKGLHPICQLRQPHLRDASKHERQIPAAALTAGGITASSSSVSARPQSKRPVSAAGDVEDRTSWVPIKRPKMQLLEGYKRAYPWRSQNNHFQRYTDVKAKDDSRLTVSELSNKRGINKCASGWRLYHIAAQFDEVSQAETDLHDQLHEMQRMLTSTSFQQRGSGRHSLDTGVAADVSRVNELAQACKQRCILIQSQLKDAREAMLMILKHKTVIMDIISKHHCRRTVKKKERT